MPSIHLLITGKVQGVYFRASAREMATQQGITGWIKNTRSGDVEVIATGTAPALEKFLDWCKSGPPGARVDDVQVQTMDETFFPEFQILR